MDGKLLDLDAPVLSFRRITAPASGENAAPPPRPRRNALPLYNSDLNSGQVGIPGAVPFVWEKTPGQPKVSSLATAAVDLNPSAPKLPPGRSLKENGAVWLKGASLAPETDTVVRTPTSITCSSGGRNEKAKVVEDEEEGNSTECGDEDDAFSDARDAFSCVESFSMNCSMSAGADASYPSRSQTKDPQAKEFMLDRFLPAAQAMTAVSPRRTWRRPSRAPVVDGENPSSHSIRRRRLPLDYQYQLSRAQLHGTNQEEEEDEEYDDDHGSYAGSGFFSSNVCGLIGRFCLKSSYGSLNPVPGVKAQGRPQPRTHPRTSPQIKVFSHASLRQTKDEDSWEAVDRYKLSHGYYPHRGDGSKLSESNQLTSLSDSQMLDDSSFLNSSGSALSLDKHEDPKRESGSWKTGSSDLCEKDYGSCWETTYSHGRLQGSGSMSPATEGPLNRCSLSLPETLDCKLVSANVPSDTKAMIESNGNSSSADDEFLQIEKSGVPKTLDGYALQSRSSKIAELGFSSCRGRLNGVEIDGNDLDNNENNDVLDLKVALLEKKDSSLALSLLLPPPTSPSESWLRRTLPSVSSKEAHQESFLGIQLHPKKQASWAPAGHHKSVTYEKPSNMYPRRTRFAEDARGS